MDKSPSQLRKQAVKAHQLWGRTRDPLAFLVEHWEAEAKSLEREDPAPHRAPGEARVSDSRGTRPRVKSIPSSGSRLNQTDPARGQTRGAAGS